MNCGSNCERSHFVALDWELQRQSRYFNSTARLITYNSIVSGHTSEVIYNMKLFFAS